MRCDKCEAVSPPNSAFCVSCGKTLSATIPNSSGVSGAGATSGPNIVLPPVTPPMRQGVPPLPPIPPQATRTTNVGLIVGSIIGVLGLLVGAGIAVASFSEDSVPSEARGSSDTESSSSAEGVDPYLDQLWAECEAGDFQSCDDLYSDSPLGSEYQEFGDTCGNRNVPSGWCVEVYATGGSSSGSSAPGEDSYLDQLWAECEYGDFQACDDLYSDSPLGSEYQEFGDTCGNRNVPSGWCVEVYASGGSSSSSSAPGQDSYLDQLWAECEYGDFQACDDLYSDSPSGSEYEEFGDTCGTRNVPSGWCVDIYW
jgi:hypothetical protein